VRYPLRRTLLSRSLWLRVVTLAVAAHSVTLGVCLLSFPGWTLRLVGWDYSGPIFWPSQAGLFLIILGVAYSAASQSRAMAWLLVGSKGSACVFLMAHALWLDAPRLAILLACVDGSMGLAVAMLLWGAPTEERRDTGTGAPRSRPGGTPL